MIVSSPRLVTSKISIKSIFQRKQPGFCVSLYNIAISKPATTWALAFEKPSFTHFGFIRKYSASSFNDFGVSKNLYLTKSNNLLYERYGIRLLQTSCDTKNQTPEKKNKVVNPNQEKLRKISAIVKPYFELARVDKPIGTMLLLWPCVWSIGMASYHLGTPLGTTAYTLALFSTGAFIMRGAGCTINDLWDIRFDRKVSRTRVRPLASGLVSPKQALGFLAIQLSAGLAILVQLNPYSIMLGAASLSLVVIYPLMKRITYWPQAVLGLAFNWGALLGWSAITGSLNLAVTVPLFVAGVNWTLIYDTIYAHQDKADDIKIGVKSTALFMEKDTKKYLAGFSVASISLLCLSGFLNGHGLPFYLATLIGGGGHLAWQLRTVDLDKPSDCWAKFCSNQKFGGLIAFGIYTDLLLNQLS